MIRVALAETLWLVADWLDDVRSRLLDMAGGLLEESEGNGDVGEKTGAPDASMQEAALGRLPAPRAVLDPYSRRV